MRVNLRTHLIIFMPFSWRLPPSLRLHHMIGLPNLSLLWARNHIICLLRYFKVKRVSIGLTRLFQIETTRLVIKRENCLALRNESEALGISLRPLD